MSACTLQQCDTDVMHPPVSPWTTDAVIEVVSLLAERDFTATAPSAISASLADLRTLATEPSLLSADLVGHLGTDQLAGLASPRT